jgi:hypothetical protein
MKGIKANGGRSVSDSVDSRSNVLGGGHRVRPERGSNGGRNSHPSSEGSVVSESCYTL